MNRLSHLLNIKAPGYVPKPGSSIPDSRLSDNRKFTMHRANAKSRSVAFELTFDEWLAWWKDTGHYHERGKRRGQYVMGRKGDVGPYALGNIECVQAQVNSVVPHKGSVMSAEHREAIAQAQIERNRQLQLRESD